MTISSFVLFIMVFFMGNELWAHFPEYGHYSRSEQNEILRPRLLDSEYQSDKLTFMNPISFYGDWLSQDQVFQYSAGSLGPSRFLSQGRFKFKKEIADHMYFQLSYFENGNFEENRQNLVFEFSYDILSWFNLSIYGQPATLKKDDTVGLATTINFDQSSLRLFYTWVHLTHNKRSEDQDEYLKSPASYGLVWRFLKEDHSFTEFFIRHDQKLEQFFTQNSRLYGFENTVLGLTQRKLLSQRGHHLQWQLDLREAFESDNTFTDNGIERWDLKSLSLLVQYENKDLLIDWFGIKKVYNHWSSVSGDVIQNDILPHAWMTVIQSPKESWASDFKLGYEMTWHRGRGDPLLRGGRDPEEEFEHRANLRYDLRFSKTSNLYILLTFDIDRFGTGETWEGGGMQFTSYF